MQHHNRWLVHIMVPYIADRSKSTKKLSNLLSHMPSAYGLGKNIIFNKVQFSSVQYCPSNVLAMDVFEFMHVLISIM